MVDTLLPRFHTETGARRSGAVARLSDLVVGNDPAPTLDLLHRLLGEVQRRAVLMVAPCIVTRLPSESILGQGLADTARIPVGSPGFGPLTDGGTLRGVQVHDLAPERVVDSLCAGLRIAPSWWELTLCVRGLRQEFTHMAQSAVQVLLLLAHRGDIEEGLTSSVQVGQTRNGPRG